MLGCPFNYWRKMTFVMGEVLLGRCAGRLLRFERHRILSSGLLSAWSICLSLSIRPRRLPFLVFAKSRIFAGYAAPVLQPLPLNIILLYF